MSLRLLLTLSLLTGLLAQVSAQTFRPLSGYEQLASSQRKAARNQLALEKMDCDEPVDLTDITLVRPGERANVLGTPDTLTLGPGITYSCNGCSSAEGGTAILRADTIRFTANEGVEEVLDTFFITACNAAGRCSNTRPVVVLTQREGRTVTLNSRNLNPQEQVILPLPDEDFIRKASCSSLDNCDDDAYPGREQLFYFDAGGINYTAARAAGTNAVCATFCTAFGLCDTYRTEVTIVRGIGRLPFFDDFSDDSFRPDARLWQDEDVLVNRNFAVLPPSLGVATFDAVDFDGRPYEDTNGGRGTVPRDYLTSTPLDMRGEDGAALSFYLQPRGLGNRPERQDSFLVQFQREDGSYETVLRIEGQLNTVPSNRELPFIPYLIPVPERFLYNGFTFRFANKSNERGAVDMWHLDYVKLSAVSNTLATDDVALTDAPGSILGPYTSLPLRHFQAAGEDLVQPAITVNLYNAADEAFNFGESKSSVISVRRGSIRITQGDLVDQNVFGVPGSFPPMEYVGGDLATGWGGLDDVRGYLNNLPLTDEPVLLTTRFDISVAKGNDESAEDNTLSNKITGNNNRAISTTELGEYMAYDDGSAEVLVEVPRNTVLVQRFTAFVTDTLRGIRIRIPRALASLGDQDLRLVVYGDGESPGERLYEEDFPIVYAEDFFIDSLQGYTTYLFSEPLALPAGNFYVGYEQLRADVNIGVGYDRNNPTAAGVQFFDASNNGEWREVRGTVTGALMVRPLLAGFDESPTAIREAIAAQGLIDVFPNPTTNLLHLRPRPDVRLADLQVKICDVAGAVIEVRAGQPTLELGNLPKGVYILTVSDGARQSNHKIVRQ